MRAVRLALAAAAVAAAASPLVASAAQPDPPCSVHWVELARTSSNLPYLVIYRPDPGCY